MKIAILAAGDSSDKFPLFFDKPKCLYHKDGKVMIDTVIEDALEFVEQKDIIVVGGYKYSYLKEHLTKYPKIEFRNNRDYSKSAVYSLRTAVQDTYDDLVIMFADERISKKNIRRICESQKKMALLYHDTFYYYSLGIMKLRKDCFPVILDKKYLTMEAIREIYCFANNKKIYDGIFTLNSGECLGYITIDLVRRIGNIKKIENPEKYLGDEIDFFHYDPQIEYLPDIDYFSDTDEYKSQILMRMYSDVISDNIKRIIRHIPKLTNYKE